MTGLEVPARRGLGQSHAPPWLGAPSWGARTRGTSRRPSGDHYLKKFASFGFPHFVPNLAFGVPNLAFGVPNLALCSESCFFCSEIIDKWSIPTLDHKGRDGRGMPQQAPSKQSARFLPQWRLFFELLGDFFFQIFF
jgi:hypothetical protein